jgi:hypothetical protein
MRGGGKEGSWEDGKMRRWGKSKTEGWGDWERGNWECGIKWGFGLGVNAILLDLIF